MSRTGYALTLGTYDGVHRGHRHVFRALEALAASKGLKTRVVAFEEPPKNHFRPDAPVPLLTLPEERRELILAAGIDRVETLRFDASIAALTPEQFFHDFIRVRWRARAVAAGEDFGFGKDRRGNVALLGELCAKHGVSLRILNLLRAESQKVSSTYVRQLLAEGQVEHAAALLGRPHFVRGEVIRGQGLGGHIGVHTANLSVDKRKVLPPGVFAVKAGVLGAGKRWKGALNIGYRPTIPGGDKALHVEVHIIGFKGDLYGKRLQVDFLRRIRPEKKFSSLAALKRQIQKDIRAASI